MSPCPFGAGRVWLSVHLFVLRQITSGYPGACYVEQAILNSTWFYLSSAGTKVTSHHATSTLPVLKASGLASLNLPAT